MIRRLENVIILAGFFALSFWLVPPLIHNARHLCPVRPGSLPEGWAVAQWSRKYGVECTTCHTAFPRITPFGEMFKMNGYQMPGEEDGDEKGKQSIGERLNIDEIGNFFGVRLAFSPLEVKTNSLTFDGNKKHLVNVGKTDWLQFFVAGSIFRNVSIFIENEISGTADNTIKVNWFYLGFHNLAKSLVGEGGSLNARFGNIPMADWHVLSGRLRMIPNIKNEVMDVKSAGGAAGNEDQVAPSSAVPGLEFFGNKGPVWYATGVSQGKKAANNPNQLVNTFGSLGLRAGDGPFEGSMISIWGMKGTDTKTTATAQIRDDFFRLSPGVNIRRGPLDVIAAWVYGEDDNWTLAAAPKTLTYSGASTQVGYTISPAWWGAVQYDYIDSAGDKSLNYNKVSPSLWYFIRQNMRVGLTTRFDLDERRASHPQKVDEYLLHLRTMF